MEKNTVGELIRNIRKQKGLSQAKLAKRLNVSQQMIGQYENNEKPPKIDTLNKIAIALECNLLDLIDNTLDIEKVQKEIEHTEQLEKLLSHEEYDYYMKYSALTDSAQDKVKSYIDFMFSDKTNRTDVE